MERLFAIPGVVADYLVGTMIVMTHMTMVGWVERQEERLQALSATGAPLAAREHWRRYPLRGYPSSSSRMSRPVV